LGLKPPAVILLIAPGVTMGDVMVIPADEPKDEFGAEDANRPLLLGV
jgi:hypothetical protein